MGRICRRNCKCSEFPIINQLFEQKLAKRMPNTFLQISPGFIFLPCDICVPWYLAVFSSQLICNCSAGKSMRLPLPLDRLIYLCVQSQSMLSAGRGSKSCSAACRGPERNVQKMHGKMHGRESVCNVVARKNKKK